MDKVKKIYRMVIDAIDNKPIVNQVIKLIIMSVIMMYNLLTLLFIYKVVIIQNFTISSVSLMIYLVLLMIFSFYIIFKKWDYKYICVYLILMSLYF